MGTSSSQSGSEAWTDTEAWSDPIFALGPATLKEPPAENQGDGPMDSAAKASLSLQRRSSPKRWRWVSLGAVVTLLSATLVAVLVLLTPLHLTPSQESIGTQKDSAPAVQQEMLQPNSPPLEQQLHPLLPPKVTRPPKAPQPQSRALAAGPTEPTGPASRSAPPGPQAGRARPKPIDMLEDRR